MKKHESQVGNYDKLKLKAIILHDDIGKEIHMTQPVRLAAEDSIIVALAQWHSFEWTMDGQGT